MWRGKKQKKECEKNRLFLIKKYGHHFFKCMKKNIMIRSAYILSFSDLTCRFSLDMLLLCKKNAFDLIWEDRPKDENCIYPQLFVRF